MNNFAFSDINVFVMVLDCGKIFLDYVKNVFSVHSEVLTFFRRFREHAKYTTLCRFRHWNHLN